MITSSTVYSTGTKRQPPGIEPPNMPAAGTNAISGGPISLVTDAPTLPAPKVPSATPWRCAENQAEVHATPLVNELPARPKNSAHDDQLACSCGVAG